MEIKKAWLHLRAWEIDAEERRLENIFRTLRDAKITTNQDKAAQRR